jgi:hypothetical protein
MSKGFVCCCLLWLLHRFGRLVDLLLGTQLTEQFGCSGAASALISNYTQYMLFCEDMPRWCFNRPGGRCLSEFMQQNGDDML